MLGSRVAGGGALGMNLLYPLHLRWLSDQTRFNQGMLLQGYCLETPHGCLLPRLAPGGGPCPPALSILSPNAWCFEVLHECLEPKPAKVAPVVEYLDTVQTSRHAKGQVSPPDGHSV